jgi:hypothetical protein
MRSALRYLMWSALVVVVVLFASLRNLTTGAPNIPACPAPENKATVCASLAPMCGNLQCQTGLDAACGGQKYGTVNCDCPSDLAGTVSLPQLQCTSGPTGGPQCPSGYDFFASPTVTGCFLSGTSPPNPIDNATGDAACMAAGHVVVQCPDASGMGTCSFCLVSGAKPPTSCTTL